MQSAYDAMIGAEKRKGASLGSIYQLFADNVSALTEFDRSRISGQMQTVVSRGDAVVVELAGSDKRINNAQVWAEIVLKAQSKGAVPRKVMDSARGARMALTPLDIERMTREQKLALESVCAVPTEKPMPGVLPALAGFECIKPGDLKQKMLPAIR